MPFPTGGSTASPGGAEELPTTSSTVAGNRAAYARATLPTWQVNREAIERARLLAGKTRRELAAAAQIDYKTLRDLLNGRRRPTIGTAHCVIRALGLDAKEVILFSADSAGSADPIAQDPAA